MQKNKKEGQNFTVFIFPSEVKKKQPTKFNFQLSANFCAKNLKFIEDFFRILEESWRLHFVGGFFFHPEGKIKTVKSTSGEEGRRSMLLPGKKRTIPLCKNRKNEVGQLRQSAETKKY